MPEAIRAFVAAELPQPLRFALAVHLAGYRRLHPGLRWVAEANLHLTMKFLGNVEVDRVSEMVRATGRACQSHPPFEIRLRGWGIFPPRGAPRVLWLGVDSGLAELERLARDVDRQLAKRGIPAETRPPSPHLTVARWPREMSGGAGGAHLRPTGLPELDLDRFRLSSLAFMRSELRPGGPVYERLAEIPGGPGPHAGPGA